MMKTLQLTLTYDDAMGTINERSIFAAGALLIPIELIIVIQESIAVSLLLKEHSKKFRAIYAIRANLASHTAGMAAMSIDSI